ncbi:MAG: hypothetical protein Q9218_004457 [Villophora microphyllina]
MKISLFLAAVLSFVAIIAFPHDALEVSHGNSLVRRVPGRDGSSSSSSSSGGHRITSDGRPKVRPAPGYEKTGYRHSDAEGTSREKARDMAAHEPTYPSHKESVRFIPHGAKTNDKRTEVREVREKGKPVNYVVHYAEDSGSHLGHQQWRFATFGENVEKARYIKDPNPSSGKRNEKIGALPKSSGRTGGGSKANDVIDETEARGMKLINADKVGNIPFTAVVAGGASSVHRDSPYQKFAMDKAEANGGTVSYSHDKSAPKQHVLPARGPYTAANKDFGKPIDERIPMDHSVLRKSRHSPDSDGRRSRSPQQKRNNKRDDGQDWDWRDFSIVETYPVGSQPADGSQLTKRGDAVGMAGHQQANVESDHPVTNTPSDMTQEYHDYLSAYEVIRSNATQLIMPFVAEMVNGSNSTYVWDAAWDIMSLADPAMNVMGPMQGGMHCFDFIEEEMIAQNTPEDTMDSIYVFHGILIAMYEEQWNKAYDALNASGALQDLVMLTDSLTTNETWAQSIAQDLAGTNDLNNWFINGPYAELADINENVLDYMVAFSGNGTAGNSTASIEAGSSGNATAAVGSATNLPVDSAVPTAGQTTPTATNPIGVEDEGTGASSTTPMNTPTSTAV